MFPGLCPVEVQQIYPSLGHEAELRDHDLGAVSNWDIPEQPSDFSESRKDIQTAISAGTEPLLQSVPLFNKLCGM